MSELELDIRITDDVAGAADVIAPLFEQQGRYHNAFHAEGTRRRPESSEVLEYVRTGFSGDEWRAALMEVDGKIVGFSLFKIVEETYPWSAIAGKKKLYVDHLFVSEEMRGRNVGGRFIEFLREYAREIGCAAIELECESENTSGKRFYERNGFFEGHGVHVMDMVL